MKNSKNFLNFLEITWILISVGLFVASIYLVRSGELQSIVRSFGILAPAVIVLLKVSTLIIAPLGGLPLYIISGALFGGFYGFLLVLFADVVGCSICFFLSRKYGFKVLGFFMEKEKIDKMIKIIEVVKNIKSLIKARVAFLPNPELFSYGAGMTSLDFWKFTLVNFAFLIPFDVMSVFFGSQIAEISAAHTLALSFFALVLMAGGLFAVYKDYQKTEGM